MVPKASNPWRGVLVAVGLSCAATSAASGDGGLTVSPRKLDESSMASPGLSTFSLRSPHVFKHANEAGFKWVNIRRGDAIPRGAMEAGTTETDGVVYVGRYNGEAGKINQVDGNMYSFWGHLNGEQSEADILVERSANSEDELTTEVPLEKEGDENEFPLIWISITTTATETWATTTTTTQTSQADNMTMIVNPDVASRPLADEDLFRAFNESRSRAGDGDNGTKNGNSTVGDLDGGGSAAHFGGPDRNHEDMDALSSSAGQIVPGEGDVDAGTTLPVEAHFAGLAPLTAPSDVERIIVLSMTVENLDYHQLIANGTLLSSFRAAVRRAIVEQARGQVHAEDVALILRAGSINVGAMVTPSSGSPEEVATLLGRASPPLSSSVAGRIGAIEGIGIVSTGRIRVDYVSISLPAPAESQALAITTSPPQLSSPSLSPPLSPLLSPSPSPHPTTHPPPPYAPVVARPRLPPSRVPLPPRDSSKVEQDQDASIPPWAAIVLLAGLGLCGCLPALAWVDLRRDRTGRPKPHELLVPARLRQGSARDTASSRALAAGHSYEPLETSDGYHPVQQTEEILDAGVQRAARPALGRAVTSHVGPSASRWGPRYNELHRAVDDTYAAPQTRRTTQSATHATPF